MRCTWRSSAEPAPTARRIANSRSRSPRVAVIAASSTTNPAASVKANRNSTALITCPSTRCTWAMVWLMSTLVMLGKARTKLLSNCGLPSGARKALIKLTGTLGNSATGNSTKKLTRMEPQSTLRRLVMRPSVTWPAMSNPSRSPSFRPSS